MTRTIGKTRKRSVRSPARPLRTAKNGAKNGGQKGARDSDMVAITALFDDFAHNLARKLAGRTVRVHRMAGKGEA